MDDLRNSAISRPVSPARTWIIVAILLDLVLVLGNEVLPAFGREFGYSVEPARIELGALVIPESPIQDFLKDYRVFAT